jgi:hypothetical protein
VQTDQPVPPLAALLAEVLTPRLFRRWLERLDIGTTRQSLCGLLDTYLAPHLAGQSLRLMWLPWSARHYLAVAEDYVPLDDWLNAYLSIACREARGALTSVQALAWFDAATGLCRPTSDGEQHGEAGSRKPRTGTDERDRFHADREGRAARRPPTADADGA